MAEITLKKLNKSYGNLEVIHNIDLTIGDKEFVVLVGPSGCGKSTTLRMIAGLEEVSNGELWIGSDLVNDVPSKDRDIAMVFQNYALYPHMTVYKNMAFGLALRKAKEAEIDSKVREVARILDIEHLLNRKPKALSGGQRQRVALGRAMVRNPEVFLLDEPLSNLDAKLRGTMRTEITKLHKRLDATFVYVTHDQVEAMTMADRIVVMRDGYILQVDTPQNLYDRPVDLFVAGFIGAPQMNFLHGRLRQADERFAFEFGGVLMPLSSEVDAGRLAPHVDAEVILGLRPEDLHEAPPPGVAENRQARLTGFIDLAETLGSEKHLNLSVGGTQVIARVSARYPAGNGETVELIADMSHAHLFDPVTERSLLCGEAR